MNHIQTNMTRLITSAQELRQLTGSYYANNDFSKIDALTQAVELELARTIGRDTMQLLYDAASQGTDAPEPLADALLAARQAVAYMATMRFYRLNDLSHENAGRKAKIDQENEARPFEWQLARDDRAHLEEYYRALDRMMAALADSEAFRRTDTYKRTEQLIVKDADSLAYLTGVDPSPWLYLRLVPFLAESQRMVAKAYGSGFDAVADDDRSEIATAAQKATALGALALMGRRLSLQAMPYGLMSMVRQEGGNSQTPPTADDLERYLKHLSAEQHYYINEMRIMRDEALSDELGGNTNLTMPDNSDPRRPFFRF